MNKRNFWQFLGSTIGRIVILAVVILFLVNIGRSIYKNYQINDQIDNLKLQIVSLEEEKINLQNRILYYQTDTHKELELRKHLGYKKPEEKVIVLYKGEEKKDEDENQIIDNQNKKPLDSQKDPTPNWQKWWEFIFG